MSKKFLRKPIANFFIKRDLQIRLILKIVLAVLISTLVCVVTLLLTYLFKYKSAVFYRVTLDIGATIGNRENIISIIFPSLIISSIVNIGIAVCIGLYASRKYAVPIFKLENWATLLHEGHFTAKLRFREKEEMRELSDKCNKLSENLRSMFEKIGKCVKELEKECKDLDSLKDIKEILSTIDSGSDSIEIHTKYLKKLDVPK